MLKLGYFIIKHPTIYYLLSWTWGIFSSLISLIMFLFLKPILKLKKIKGDYLPCKRHVYVINRNLKTNSFGFSFGLLICISKDLEDNFSDLVKHEFGHSVQNCIFGIFTIFLVYIPSMIRFWYREYQLKKGYQLKPYDSIWFEKTATEFGNMI